MSEAVAAAPARQTAAAEPGAKPELRLQRKCACGQHTVAGGECAECRKQRLTTQRWSTLGPTPGAMLRDTGTSLTGDAPGADLSAVRTLTPELRTAPRIQREDAGAPAQETAEATEETEPEAVESAPETESSQATPPDDAAGAPEGGASPESQSSRPGPALLAEDDAADVPAGQMRKTEFLDQLQRAVCAEADQALAAAGRSTEGCPYIAQAFGRYRGQSAAQVESGLRRYAPETRDARTAAETIPILAARVRRGVDRWVATGEISGVPDDAPISIPTGGLGGLLGGVARGIGSLLFKADEGGARPADDPAAVHAELGDGQAMESGVRGRMERAFGRSFGGVRMHTDATAGRLSAEQNARAFTVGGHVAFAAGEYRPGTMAGDALIAHELAHTVQQGGGSSAVQAKAADSAGYGALEADADRSAAGVVARLWGAAKETAHGIAQNTGPALRSGLSIQRCSPKPPQARTPAQPGAAQPGAPAGDAAPAKPEDATAPAKPAEPEVEPAGGWCAKPATHTEIVALMKTAGKAEPVGTLAYGFTYWAKAATAKRPKLSILFGPAPGGKVKGTVERTSTDIGSIQALYLQKGTWELPGKKFNVTGTGCGPSGKQVPIFSAVSEDMSLLSRRAEQEHCDDYHRAFDLTYVKEVANINSIAGTPFIGASKAAVKADINTTLAAKGDKGIQGWIDEINRLARISETTRDDGLLHRLKPDGDPQTVDAGCTRKDTTTVLAPTTKVPGPKTEDIIK